jgi:peptide deformylase
MKILTNPNPILFKKSSEVNIEEIISQNMKELGTAMIETMLGNDGVGLAAPQIGYNLRLISVSTKEGPTLLFNPKIIKKSWRKEWEEEGCLSIPLIFGEVKRNYAVTCVYHNENGQEKKLKAKGLLARAVQHEIDHLDGILFISKAKKLKKINEAEIEEE